MCCVTDYKQDWAPITLRAYHVQTGGFDATFTSDLGASHLRRHVRMPRLHGTVRAFQLRTHRPKGLFGQPIVRRDGGGSLDSSPRRKRNLLTGASLGARYNALG